MLIKNNVFHNTYYKHFSHQQVQALRMAFLGKEAIISKDKVKQQRLKLLLLRAYMSHAAPYRHFQDKESLLAAVAEEGFIGLTQAMNRRIEQAPDEPLKRLEATGVAYVKFAVAHPSHYRVMFGSCQGEQASHLERAQAGWQAFQVLFNAIEAGQSTGVLKVGDTMYLGWTAWSTVHGLAMLLIDGRLPVSEAQDIQALSEFVTRTLIVGLAVRLCNPWE